MEPKGSKFDCEKKEVCEDLFKKNGKSRDRFVDFTSVDGEEDDGLKGSFWDDEKGRFEI